MQCFHNPIYHLCHLSATTEYFWNSLKTTTPMPAQTPSGYHNTSVTSFPNTLSARLWRLPSPPDSHNLTRNLSPIGTHGATTTSALSTPPSAHGLPVLSLPNSKAIPGRLSSNRPPWKLKLQTVLNKVPKNPKPSGKKLSTKTTFPINRTKKLSEKDYTKTKTEMSYPTKSIKSSATYRKEPNQEMSWKDCGKNINPKTKCTPYRDSTSTKTHSKKKSDTTATRRASNFLISSMSPNAESGPKPSNGTILN